MGLTEKTKSKTRENRKDRCQKKVLHFQVKKIIQIFLINNTIYFYYKFDN